MGSVLEYGWRPAEDYDALYYSRVFGLRLERAGEGAALPPLPSSLFRCRLASMPPPLAALPPQTPPGKKSLSRAAQAAAETAALLSLFPCPVYTSPLRMALDAAAGNEGSPILQNSFDAIQQLFLYEQSVARSSKLPDEAKAKVQKTRDQFLHRIAQFSRVEGGLHRCFQLPPPPNLETERAFIKENFFTTVNCLRVLEFTILDYLGVEEALQSSFATYSAATLPKSPKIKAACWKSIIKWHTDKFPALCKDIDVTCSIESNRFIPSAVLATLFKATKTDLLKSYVFKCSNTGCTQTETASARFPRCAQCGWARYHSKECQAAHWKSEHKAVCLKPIDLKDLDKERLLIGGSSQEEREASKQE